MHATFLEVPRETRLSAGMARNAARAWTRLTKTYRTISEISCSYNSPGTPPAQVWKPKEDGENRQRNQSHEGARPETGRLRREREGRRGGWVGGGLKRRLRHKINRHTIKLIARNWQGGGHTGARAVLLANSRTPCSVKGCRLTCAM